MELARDFDEFFGSLIAHSVDFLVVGAYALAYHGAPRFTGDIDVFVRPSKDNASRLLLPFIGRREFVKNKRAAGRLKDLADIEALDEP